MASISNDPGTPEEVERFLEGKILKGEAGTGLYDCGFGFVVVDLIGADGDNLRFQWFEHAVPFSDLLISE